MCEAESSYAVIIGIVLVFHRDGLFLFYSVSTYSYLSSYFASYPVLPHDSLSDPAYVSTPVEDSIILDCVYHSCVVRIGSLETSIDFTVS